MFAVADKAGNAALCVCDKLSDLVSVDGLVGADGEPLHYFNKAEHLPGWATDLDFKCVVTKRLIEVEIAE